MEISSVGNYRLVGLASHPHANTKPVKETISAPRSVEMTYDTSIGRTVSQVVAEGEVVRQVPSANTISFIRSFSEVISRIFKKRI